jgi:signal transduction histidine kinase
MLPDDAKAACKEVMEQAIRNALAHAKPSCITVDLCFSTDAGVELSVADNGSGFEPLPYKTLRLAGHHGLPNMQERAELAGGELAIESAPGKGTVINMHIPPQCSNAEGLPALLPLSESMPT